MAAIGGGVPAAGAASDGFSPQTTPPEVFLTGYLARIRFFDWVPHIGGDDSSGDSGGGRHDDGWKSAAGGSRGVGVVVPPATAATLARLQAAHLLALPFENLSVFSTRQLPNSVDAAWAKMVASRRGGWCLEHNALLVGVCRALGYPAVTPRVGWVLPDPSVSTLVALFGGGGEADAPADGDDGGDVGTAAAAALTPPRHLVVEVEVAGHGETSGGALRTPSRAYLVDAGNGRSFATPLLLRGGGENTSGGAREAAEGRAGGGPHTGPADRRVGEPVCQPDGVWWRVVPLSDVLTAAGVLPSTLRTLPGSVDNLRVVQWATPAPCNGDSATVDAPPGEAAAGSAPMGLDAAWNCFYVLDAARVLGSLSELDGVRDFYQGNPDSLFRRRRLLTRPVDGGRRLAVLANGTLRVGTSAGTEGAGPGEVVSGGEAGWRAAVADQFDVVLSAAEAARLAEEMPLPPPEGAPG